MKTSIWIFVILIVAVCILPGCIEINFTEPPGESAASSNTPAAATATPAATEAPAPTPSSAPSATVHATVEPTLAPTETPAPPTPTASGPNADVLGLWITDDGTSTVEFFSDGTATIVNAGESMSGAYTYEKTTLSGRITIPEGYWLFDLSPDKTALHSIIKEYHRN